MFFSGRHLVRRRPAYSPASWGLVSDRAVHHAGQANVIGTPVETNSTDYQVWIIILLYYFIIYFAFSSSK